MNKVYHVSFQIVDQLPATMVARVSGLAYLAPAIDAFKTIEVETKTRRTAALLLDIRDVLGALGLPERAALARMSLQYLPHLEKLAWLTDPEKVGQEAARDDLRPRIRIFCDQHLALDWLAGESSGISSKAPRHVRDVGAAYVLTPV